MVISLNDRSANVDDFSEPRIFRFIARDIDAARLERLKTLTEAPSLSAVMRAALRSYEASYGHKDAIAEPELPVVAGK